MPSKRLPTDLPRFGDRLKWAIGQHPAIRSQAGLSREMGASSAYVAELAGRTKPPGKRALSKLSETLGVPEAWLAYGAPSEESGGQDAPLDTDAEFWREYRAIHARDDMSDQWKMWKVDQLTAALRQLTQARDADAANGRIRLMERDVDNEERRTKAANFAPKAGRAAKTVGRVKRGKPGDAGTGT